MTVERVISDQRSAIRRQEKSRSLALLGMTARKRDRRNPRTARLRRRALHKKEGGAGENYFLGRARSLRRFLSSDMNSWTSLKSMYTLAKRT